MTRNQFKKEDPEWITPKPAVEADWSACLQTLEGHSDSVSSVAFSHDGNPVASGSDDQTVKIWDASSGASLQTLDFGQIVFNISFDATGSYVWTSIGIISLNISSASTAPALQEPQYQGYHLSADRVWIT
jgi:WD40 repeat protein